MLASGPAEKARQAAREFSARLHPFGKGLRTGRARARSHPFGDGDPEQAKALGQHVQRERAEGQPADPQ